MNKQILASSELIGMETHISQSMNPQLIGKRGVIIDETKSTFTIETDTGKKIIPKQINYFEFKVNDTTITLNGDTITKRSQDRIGIKV